MTTNLTERLKLLAAEIDKGLPRCPFEGSSDACRAAAKEIEAPRDECSARSVQSCGSCHWYSTSERSGDWSLCVWHTGNRGTAVHQIKAGKRPIRTRFDFGCVAWQKDERSKET